MATLLASLSVTFILVQLKVSVGVQTWPDWHGKSIYFLMTDRFAPSTSSWGADERQCGGDLRCGGTLRGIAERLDYIKGMGFDAIWITPVVDQVPQDWGEGWRTDAYHGYWARNLYEVDQHFGTKEDLKHLVQECHRRDMLFMLDTVPNHMGPIKREKLEHFYPFNHESDYHTLFKPPNESFLSYAEAPTQNQIPGCWPGMYDCEGYNQTIYEMGWFGDLGDLNQENPSVARKLRSWITEMVQNYSLDGLRLDTAPYMPQWFLKEFQDAAGITIIGETTTFNVSYLVTYQKVLQGMFNFPQWHKMRDVFLNSGSLADLALTMEVMSAAGFPDLGLLCNFVDNQDNPRFLSQRHDLMLLKNQITLTMLMQGIPMVYYGTEQAFAQNEPRDSLWPYYDDTSDMYRFIRELNRIRKMYLLPGQQRIIFSNERSLALSHGDLIVVVTNVGIGAAPMKVCLPLNYLEDAQNLFGPQPFKSSKSDELCINLVDGHPAVLVRGDALGMSSKRIAGCSLLWHHGSVLIFFVGCLLALAFGWRRAQARNNQNSTIVPLLG